MADSFEKNDKSDKEKKEIDKPMENTGSNNVNFSICQKESSLENHLKKSEVHKEKKGEVDVEITEQETNSQCSTSQETKSSNLAENLAKRSKYDKNDDQCDSDSNKDCSKRQKVKECQPHTTTSDDTERNNGSNTSNFLKCSSRVKKRNYRSQTIESTDDSINEDSSSSESNESSDFPPIEQQIVDSSADERSETTDEHVDSVEWTTTSDDDSDEIPSVLQKEPPKSNWSFLKDIANRQIGSNYNVPQHFYSSLYAVQRLYLMNQLEAHIGCVNTINFNEKGNLLASASDDLTITIWDWARGKKHVTVNSGHRSNVFQAKWLPLDEERFVVSSARDGQVRMIDVENGFTKKLACHRAACNKIATHYDLPHIILSAGEDSKIFSIDVREKPSKLLTVKDDDQEIELYSIDSHPLNSYEFCVAGRMRYVNVYDRRKPTSCLYQMCPKHLSDAHAHMTCAVYNHNGTEVIASYNNEDIYLFDSTSSYQSGDFAHKYQGHCNSVTLKSVNFFGPNSEFILSGSDCGNIFVWDKKSEAIVQWMLGDNQGVVNALEPHPHIPILATSGLDCDVKIWIPSREDTPNIKKELESCIKKNLTNKAKSAEEAESVFDNQVLWIMLRHSRYAERQRLAQLRNQNPNNMSDDNDDDYDDDNEDDDEDDEDDYDDDDDDEIDSNSSSSNNNSSESDSHSES